MKSCIYRDYPFIIPSVVLGDLEGLASNSNETGYRYSRLKGTPQTVTKQGIAIPPK